MSKNYLIKSIPLTTLLIIASFQFVSGIKCYKCLPKTTPKTVNQTIESCSLFDASYEFQIDCPLSTFCMKRNFTLDFPDGRKAVVTERGCAPQSFSYRIFKRGKWEVVNNIDEKAYENGCVLEHQEAGHPTQYCYCSSRLCNNGSLVVNNIELLIMALIFLVFYRFKVH